MNKPNLARLTAMRDATAVKLAPLTAEVNRELDAAAWLCAPVAARWDAEADRRMQLRTPENLKALMKAQREHTSARATASVARSQRAAAKKASKNPWGAARRSAAVADRAAHSHRKEARVSLQAAKRSYPSTLTATAVRAHTVHVLPAGVASWALSTPVDWALWPASVSAGLVAANVLAVKLGRRKVTASVPDDASAEERALMERLDPSYWVQHAEARGLAGTVTTPPAIRRDGIECEIRLDGKWTVKALRAAADSVRALLGARTELPMLIAHASRGGWAVLRLRTRSAAPDGIIPWVPGGPLGIDMVTGDEVRVPLGLRMLIAGTSGAGKSTASRPLLFEASEGPLHVLVIIDLKKVEGRLWDHRARVASKPVDVVELVQELTAELDERLDQLPKGQATLVPTAERPRITIVVDEGAEVMSHCQKVEVVVGYTEKGAEITEKLNALEGLDTLARMGRAACMDLWWMTQSPTYGDGVPRQIAKQLSTRLGLAVESPTEARVVFGESAQEKGWKADELPMPGVAMLRDGKRSPDPVKVVLMDDPQVIALPAQPIWSRGATAAGVPAAQPAERPALRLVKDEAAVTESAPAAVVQTAPAEPVSNRDRVLAAVRDGARTGRDITDRTGINKGTVSKAVKSLIETGELVKDADHGLVLGGGAEEVSA
ncbi:MarR family transcriptional regulator [Streptomyces sp. NPDC058542]|uniref:MarR family transcriptional regulator n=1 Tax=Streptomyces sp. NPDC058542 TaxID=3346543 RepID=UPI003665ADD5